MADGQLTGLDQGFGGLLRLARRRSAHRASAVGPRPQRSSPATRFANTLPVGLLRVARAGAMLAARRGETDRALGQLAEAEAQPVDGWHQSVRDAAVADVHLALGNWDEAALAAERGWESTQHDVGALGGTLRDARASSPTVEQALDDLARRQPVDFAANDLPTPGTNRRRSNARSSSRRQPPDATPSAHLAHAAASLTRLTASDADAWADAAALLDRPRRPMGDRDRAASRSRSCGTEPAPRIGRRRRSDTPTRSPPNSAPPHCWPRSTPSPVGPGSASKPQLDSCSTRAPPTASG